MSQHSTTPAAKSSRFGGLSGRSIAGIVIGILVLLFIVVNRHETRVSFLVVSAETALWIALALAAAGGFVAGFLIGRRRYRA